MSKKGTSFHNGGVQTGGVGKNGYSDPSFPPANPAQPQYPPGSEGWRKAGSPMIPPAPGTPGPGMPIPNNSTLIGARRGAVLPTTTTSYPNGVPTPETQTVGGPIQQPGMAAVAEKEVYTPTDLGGGAMQMRSNMGNQGNRYDFNTNLPPLDSPNPADQALIQSELAKASEMYNEPGKIQDAAMKQISGGSTDYALDPAKEQEILDKNKNLAPKEIR